MADGRMPISFACFTHSVSDEEWRVPDLDAPQSKTFSDRCREAVCFPSCGSKPIQTENWLPDAEILNAPHHTSEHLVPPTKKSGERKGLGHLVADGLFRPALFLAPSTLCPEGTMHVVGGHTSFAWLTSVKEVPASMLL
jgi:hypothetical protein